MRLLSSYPRPVRDVALLVGRVLLGVIFVAHGWQKLNTNGMDATAKGFAGMDIPAPTASAWFAALVELGGGALLILGAFTAVAGTLLAVNMAGAAWFAHVDNGLFLPSGWEFVAALGAGALAFAAWGAGRFSVDHLLSGSAAQAVGPLRRSRAAAEL
ncbi:DoxX family protein [Flexivirga meconopsidis]|uniref:DoxX family protein n=1 Tax=Flexivirga meconopsidis TaxID=2977121 RepID=UPI00223ED08B|nr:DoxX family protein [Flexivirga meconopsidis]